MVVWKLAMRFYFLNVFKRAKFWEKTAKMRTHVRTIFSQMINDKIYENNWRDDIKEKLMGFVLAAIRGKTLSADEALR